MASIFTRIINGEIPCYKVAENDTHIAILDINPIAEGHTLVIPKEETDYFFDLDDQVLSATMVFAKKIAEGIDSALNPLRTGVIIQGLEVPHAHVHLVPLYKESQSMAFGNPVTVDKNRMEEIAKIIAAEVEL
jgi:histidine triad (HIT) family protein